MFLQIGCDCGEIGLRQLDIRVRFEPSDGFEAMAAALLRHRLVAIGSRRVFGDGKVKLDCVALDGILETRRHHTDDGVKLAVEFEGTADHVWIAAEILSPGVIANDDFESAGSAPGLLVVAREGAAYYRLDPEHIEKLGARPDHVHTPGALLSLESI